MEAIVDYFSEMPSLHRSMVLVGGLTFFLLVEQAVPLFTIRYNKWRHTGLNVFFTVTTVLVNFSMAFVIVLASDWVVSQPFGVLQWLAIPLWAKLIVGLFIMDFFSAWLAHYTMHKVKWMWQFHTIHHSDQHVDTTTANRHHPGESMVRFLFTTMAVLVAGAPIWLVFLYQSMSVVLSQFNHANITLPTWLDRGLVWVFCTPNMHRVHHHYRQPYSDANYGNIFSIWDRVFSTYKKVDNEKLVYGLDTYMDSQESANVWRLLKIPFEAYRPTIRYDKEEEL